MTLIRRPSPFGELLSLRQAMDRLFDDRYVRPTHPPFAGLIELLPLDIRTERDELVVQAALPGVKPEDVEITVEAGTLTIRACSSEEHSGDGADAGYVLQEIRRGELARSVTLPDGLVADRAAATFEDGLLTLRIPRADEVKPRRIRIDPVTRVGDAATGPASDGPSADGAHGAGR